MSFPTTSLSVTSSRLAPRAVAIAQLPVHSHESSKPVPTCFGSTLGSPTSCNWLMRKYFIPFLHFCWFKKNATWNVSAFVLCITNWEKVWNHEKMYLPLLLMFWVCLLLRIFFHNISLRHCCHPSMKVPSCKVSKCLDPKLASRPLALRRYSFLKVRFGKEAKGRRSVSGPKKTPWTLMKVDQFMRKFHFNHIVSIVHEFICGYINQVVNKGVVFFWGLIQLYDFPFGAGERSIAFLTLFSTKMLRFCSVPQGSQQRCLMRSRQSWCSVSKIWRANQLTLPSDFWGFWGSLQRSAFRRKIHENFPGSVHRGTPNITR